MLSYIRNPLLTRIVVLGIGVVVAFALALVSLHQAGAAPIDEVNVLKQCNSQSNVCKGTDEDTLFDLIQNIINLLLMIIGVIAVIMIIIGGIRYVTSAGDAGQTKMAKDTILYAIIGLVVAIMSYAIVNWVLNRL